MTTFLPMYTYEPTTAALTIEFSPMNTWSPIWSGKKATLKRDNDYLMRIVTYAWDWSYERGQFCSK